MESTACGWAGLATAPAPVEAGLAQLSNSMLEALAWRPGSIFPPFAISISEGIALVGQEVVEGLGRRSCGPGMVNTAEVCCPWLFRFEIFIALWLDQRCKRVNCCCDVDSTKWWKVRI